MSVHREYASKVTMLDRPERGRDEKSRHVHPVL
jgi:hypothetical protein